MNYLEEIKNRSVFLWQSLFGEERSADWDVPVTIDGAAAALYEAAAAQEPLSSAAAHKMDAPKTAPERPQTQSAQEPSAPAAKASAGDVWMPEETVLRGVAENNAGALLRRTEAAAVQAARQQHRAQTVADEEISGRAPGTGWRPEAPDASAASAAAEKLLVRVQQTERSVAAAGREAPAAAVQERGAAANRMAAGPADWSLCFERDARRYDGAYELL